MFKSKVKLERLVIAPIAYKISVDLDFIRFIKAKILESNPVLKQGDRHIVYPTKRTDTPIEFEVVEIFPEEGMIGKKTIFRILEGPVRDTRRRIKCQRIKPDEELVIGFRESIVRYDTAWRIEDGVQVPDYLVVWVICAPVDKGGETR